MRPAEFASHVAAIYPEFRADHLTPSDCTHAPIQRELRQLAASPLLRLEDIGRSLEGRVLTMASAGNGARRVMLWSQMHGDEPTATLALMDILHALVLLHDEPWVRILLQGSTVHMIPLVNPDGAERKQRRNAVGIDVNRDALVLASPEARVLFDTQRRLRPEFGFNLHDQELSSVGDSSAVAALALLAPPPSPDRSATPTRLRAMHVGALVSRILEPLARGHLTRYDDVHEPRAFGDLFQGTGTSTVLIESGHWPQDPKKEFVRKLNVVGILTALRAIASGAYEDTELDYYTRLPQNGKRVVDVLVRGVLMQHPSGWTHTVDLGLMVLRAGGGLQLQHIGDLRTHAGLQTLTVADRPVPAESLRFEQIFTSQQLSDLLQICLPA